MASYSNQKKAAFARLKVSAADALALRSGQFTLFDFVEHAFSFSPKRRQLAASVLSLLKQQPLRFKELEKQTSAQKSALHFVLSSLENSGLVEKNEDGVYLLSTVFSNLLSNYALFWKNWAEQKA